MLRAFRTSGLHLGIAALYALATIFVGLSHRPVAAASVDLPTNLSAYAIPGATGLVLCLSSENEDGTGKIAAKAGPCEACRLTAAPGLVAVPDTGYLVVRFATFAVPCVAASVAPNGITLHDYQSRAPPGVS
ncbi:hypothetical protein [Pseudolabrys sp. FHR47]|uniref:hypothetical protein n=1 Tax=Pseudolabrys sp. FHR47 TaxID=2562284 RepID=UPI0010BE3CC4|nr:hypothetical protein [Pseudolabrys sp. FHR47]